MVAVVAAAAWPTTTRYGVDYQWSSRRITLFEKAVHFVSRDLQLRRMAAEIAGDQPMDEDGLVRLYDWVRSHVATTPPGFHVYDDHVLNILIRGYGARDQQAEALAALASYRGLPSRAIRLRAGETGESAVLTVISTGAKRVAFDVHYGVVFRRRDGSLADVDDLLRDQSLVAAAAPGLTIAGVPYERYIAGIAAPDLTFDRMELQKPWPRFKAEIRHLFGR